MNCQQTRHLLSAYLDQELTGHEMLEIRAHLQGCPPCSREWREINEVRLLLRSLMPHSPSRVGEQRLARRMDQEAAYALFPFAAFLLRWLPTRHPDWPFSSITPLQAPLPRARRFASALALSSIAVLAVAAPFAPSTGDAAIIAGVPAGYSFAPASASIITLPSVDWGRSMMTFLRPAAAITPETPPQATPEFAPAEAGGMEFDALRDEAVSGYVQGDATLATYNVSASGAR